MPMLPTGQSHYLILRRGPAAVVISLSAIGAWPCCSGYLIICYWSVALLQWLKVTAWIIGNHGLEPRSSIQISKEQNVSSPLIHLMSLGVVYRVSEKQLQMKM